MPKPHRPAPLSYDSLRDEYARLVATMTVRPEWAARIDLAARRLVTGRERYEAVEAETGVPWHVVGLIHTMEASGRWDRHLHNGDPLTARTVQVPRGLPAAGEPPFSWVESACDALRHDRLDRIQDWDVARICHALEVTYNGPGYRQWHPEVLSPYLWSGSTHYSRGKYTADGKWSAAAVSAQAGAIPILVRLAELCPAVVLYGHEPDPASEFVRTPSIAPGDSPAGSRPPGAWREAGSPAPPRSMAQSTEGHAAVVVGGTAGALPVATELSGAVTKVASSGKPFSIADFAVALGQSATFWLGVVALLGTTYLWLRRRARLGETP